MIYSGFETQANGRVTKCPCCENEEVKNEDVFCKICGTPVINKCTNSYYDNFEREQWECGEIGDGSARFCTKCGHPTTYSQLGLLKPWEDVKRERNLKVFERDFSDMSL